MGLTFASANLPSSAVTGGLHVPSAVYLSRYAQGLGGGYIQRVFYLHCAPGGQFVLVDVRPGLLTERRRRRRHARRAGCLWILYTQSAD